MTDRKSSKQGRRKQKGRGKSSLSKVVPMGHLMYQNRFEVGLIASGTSGTISFSVSPTIQNSSEISGLMTLFSEVRLISAVLTIATRSPAVTSIFQGSMIVGTNMQMNATTFTAPTSTISVQNLDRKAEYSTSALTVQRYRMKVPRGLEYSQLADTPTIPSPFSGSPGMILGWADNLTASTSYFIAHLTTVHELRGRN